MWIECDDDKMCFHKYSRISVKDNVALCGVWWSRSICEKDFKENADAINFHKIHILYKSDWHWCSYPQFQPPVFHRSTIVGKSFLQSSNSVSLFQSNYASFDHQQDTDFSSPYSARARMYDLPSSSTFGAPHHHMSSSSTSSLTGIGLGGPSTSAGFNNQQQHQFPPGQNPLTNIIINYLPQDCNERELHSLFSPMGPVETCRVVRDFKVSDFYYSLIGSNETNKINLWIRNK